MSSYTTRTAEFGRIEFFAPGATDSRAGHVFVRACDDSTDQIGRQICRGGDFMGDTIMAYSDDISSAAQRWLRARRRRAAAEMRPW